MLLTSELVKEIKMVLRNLITIRQHIDEGCVSYAELAYLQEHQATVVKFFSDDVVMLEWAGVPEFEE